MLKSFALLAVFGHSAVAATPIREVTSEAVKTTTPAFFKGYIYWAGTEPLRVYTPDGHLAPTIPTPYGTVQAIAVDTDGTLAVAWNTRIEEGGIDLHDSSGALVRSIHTGRYLPTHLSFAEDHSLWSVGRQPVGSPFKPDREDYKIVRKFLPNGEQAGAYLPRSLFPSGLEPGAESWWGTNRITVSHDRVGLWLISGMDSSKTEWVELDLNGSLTGRWKLDPFFSDLCVAITSDAHVFVYHRDLDGRNPHLLTLDRATSTWQPVQAPPEGSLVGADGHALIFADEYKGPIHLRWYEHP